MGFFRTLKTKRFGIAMLFLLLILGSAILAMWGISKLDADFVAQIKEAEATDTNVTLIP